MNLRKYRDEDKLPIRKRELLDIFRDNPRSIIENKELFVRFCEEFIVIQYRQGTGTMGQKPVRFNNAQHAILNVYFDAKSKGLPVRCIGLKGRQMGFSTCVEIIGFVDTICKGGQNMLIASEHKEKSGKNIYEMFYKMLINFPIELPTSHIQSGKMIQFADQLARAMINISGETMSTSYTYKFIHLSEAAFFLQLNDFLNMLLQTVLETDPDTVVFLETTANRFGDEFYDRWQRAKEGRTNYTALFIPWFVHEEYTLPFDSPLSEIKSAEEFEESMNTPHALDEYGDEVKLLSTPPYEVKHSEDDIRVEKITLEKLNWRRMQIRGPCDNSIKEFQRQYPTNDEEAFINAAVNVLDPTALIWYREKIQREIENGDINWTINEAFPNPRNLAGHQIVETRQGVILIYEPYHPLWEYILCSDHAEGLESGDFNVAYIISRNPKRIVAKIRGYDGRRLDPDEFAYQMFAMYQKYDTWVCGENNNDAPLVAMKYMGCNKFIMEGQITGKSSERMGWRNTETTRKKAEMLLKQAIRKKLWHIPDMMLIDECRTLVYKNGKMQAARKGERRPPGSSAIGFYDDCVFAFVGGLLADDALPPARSPERVQEDLMYQQSVANAWEQPALGQGESVYSRGWA